MTLYLADYKKISRVIRDRLAGGSRDAAFLLGGTIEEVHAATVELVRERTSVASSGLARVVVLEHRETDAVLAVSRLVHGGKASMLDHTAVGHLSPIEEAENSLAAMCAAALFLLPAHRVIALVGPARLLLHEARRCTDTLASKLEQSGRVRHPTHVRDAVAACERLAVQRGLSVTQSALFKRTARSAAVRLGVAPPLLSEINASSGSWGTNKQQRNSWFREMVRQLDECGRPEL